MCKRGLWVILAVLLLLMFTATVAWAAPARQQDEGTGQSALWAALAPLIAIATSIERVMERFWERWEDKDTWPNKNGVSLEERQSDVYKQFKKDRVHWLGFGLAVVAIGLTNVRLFRLLGLDVLFSASVPLFDLGVGGVFDEFTPGTLIDWLGTAFVIGWGGTELTHSVITGLVRGRKLWEEMREVQRGEKSLLDVQFFQQEIAPQLEAQGVTVASLREAFTMLRQVGVSVDDLIANMTVGKAEEFLSGLEGEAGRTMLSLLQGTPEAKGPDPIQLGKVLDKLAPDLRQRFLGA